MKFLSWRAKISLPIFIQPECAFPLFRNFFHHYSNFCTECSGLNPKIRIRQATTSKQRSKCSLIVSPASYASEPKKSQVALFRHCSVVVVYLNPHVHTQRERKVIKRKQILLDYMEVYQKAVICYRRGWTKLSKNWKSFYESWGDSKQRALLIFVFLFFFFFSGKDVPEFDSSPEKQTPVFPTSFFELKNVFWISLKVVFEIGCKRWRRTLPPLNSIVFVPELSIALMIPQVTSFPNV